MATISTTQFPSAIDSARQNGVRFPNQSLDYFTRDYVSADDSDMPAFNVFTRRDGSIRYFCSGEMGGSTADPGQNPRGAPDLMPLWTIFDGTPEGRGGDWYPELEHGKKAAAYCR